MTNATLTRLAEERSSQESFISELLAAAETETRDLVETELRSIQTAEGRIAEIDAQMAPLAAFETRRAAAVQIPGTGPTRQSAQFQVAETRSLGEIWTESEQFRNFAGRGTSDVLEIPEFRAVGPDPLLTTTDPGKKLLPAAQKFAGPEHFRTYPLLSLVGAIQVSSNVVEFFVTTDATGADIVPEGEQKPPVVWDAALSNFTLQTIAGWFKFSRQAAEDIPQLRSLVDQKIRRAIDTKLNGLAAAALLTAKTAGNTSTVAGKPMLEAIRVAMGELEARGIPVGAIAVNPADRASLDIAMLGATMNGAQLYGSFFGVPVISLVDVPKGTAVVGDLGEALTWFYRAGLSLYTTDSDVSGTGATVKSDFRANILTTLGEVRGVFGVTDASALQFATV